MSIELPPASELLPARNASVVAEMRNHIVASQWIAERASQSPGTAGLSKDEVRAIAALMLRDSASALLYKHSRGDKINPGDYRRLPIQVRSNPLRIFAYPRELPTLVREFFAWQSAAHEQKSLHPLMLACHSTVYFLSIHLFIDGNGPTTRAFMQDYMIRQNLLPIVTQNVERQEYYGMVEAVLGTQLEMLRVEVMG
jgi:Fic family protein